MADRSLAVRAVAATFVSIAFVAVCLRVYCRSRVVKSFGWDDGLMVVAMLFYIMYSGSMIGGSLYGTGKRFEDITPSNALMAMRYWWLCEIGYCFSSVFCKASVCVFLLRITVRRVHNWILYLVMFFTVATGLLFMFLMLLQCRPLSFFWTRVGPNPPTDGSCITMDGIIAMTYVYSVFAAICDLTAGILPIFLVWNLNMDFNLKVAVVGILGLACMSVSFGPTELRFVSLICLDWFLVQVLQ
ncbi:hypothetical protein N7474_010580 [Penicillium riverlandense]|uniref:uncharacterized protein n=1 Tax=Penicillium riverlandense TaxID=1903569 RepID=UPI00254683A5|nr:uncharacterized protein N7474_010580 [Penicillium riverlandense]KAJ5806988.1 hypothetical protein N7474_010580 [Penicillium riverlandense]